MGKQRTWESAERSTRPKESPIDGVGIVAVLQKSSGPELLLQKQFRPPINKVVIEVPAGLVDEGEQAEESAVRELREETGYVGIAAGMYVSEIIFLLARTLCHKVFYRSMRAFLPLALPLQLHFLPRTRNTDLEICAEVSPVMFNGKPCICFSLLYSDELRVTKTHL